MTNQQILKQAIEKAEKNGYKYEYQYKPKILQYNLYYFFIIFSHDFAKAFWGEEYVNRELRLNMEDCLAWRHHLQAMVLEKEPLQYLKRFL